MYMYVRPREMYWIWVNSEYDACVFLHVIFLREHVHVYLQVVVGDQMTCKNIRSARALMQPEINPLKQLNWVHEVPGKQLHVYSFIYMYNVHVHVHGKLPVLYLYLQVHV